MVSLSRSGSGQPLVFGLVVVNPAVSGQASSASTTPSLSRSDGGKTIGAGAASSGGGEGVGVGGTTGSGSRSRGTGMPGAHSTDRTPRFRGEPRPEVSPAAMPAPTRTALAIL